MGSNPGYLFSTFTVCLLHSCILLGSTIVFYPKTSNNDLNFIYVHIWQKLNNLWYTSDNNTKYSFDLHYRYPGSENQTSTFWQVMSWLSRGIKGSVLIMLQNPIRGHCKSNTLSSGTKESTNVRLIRNPKLASQSFSWSKVREIRSSQE